MHDARRILGFASLCVFIHQACYQRLVEAAPVDPDAHRFFVAAGRFDHVGKLLVTLLATTDIAGVDAILGERLCAIRVVCQQLVTIEMKVTNQGNQVIGLLQLPGDCGHGACGILRVNGDAHQLGTGLCQFPDLLYGRGNIGRVGVRHGLHHDGRVTPNDDIADLYSHGVAGCRGGGYCRHGAYDNRICQLAQDTFD